MCGPIITGYVAQKPIAISLPDGRSETVSSTLSLTSHVMYHTGRIISYSLIGAMAGLAGAAIMIGSTFQSTVSIILGIFMIVFGLGQLGLIKVKRKSGKESIGTRVLSSLSKSAGVESRLILGLLTPLLPCGLLYGMAAAAAATNSPFSGALTMGAFALGSVPALFAAGLMASTLGSKFKLFGTRFAVILLIIMGLLTIGRGAGFYKGGALFSSEKESCCEVKADYR
jgi:uncharacterized protein